LEDYIAGRLEVLTVLLILALGWMFWTRRDEDQTHNQRMKWMKAYAKWKLVKALRSGKYRQVKGKTRDCADGFCVMGLAHHLHIEPFTFLEESAVVRMNHGTDMTFDEIADKVEAGDFVASQRPPTPPTKGGPYEPERQTEAN
jgi:hypothetical protein